MSKIDKNATYTDGKATMSYADWVKVKKPADLWDLRSGESVVGAMIILGELRLCDGKK